MATGTGKTYTTFQIIWRLWKAKAVKRVLFLVDRNILADQTRVNDFKPFGSVMTKIKNRKIDPSYEIHLGLYQALTGPDEEDKVYKAVSRDFFDLIVIDECHRGSAAEDSSWREILEYFSGAIHLGLTATPKETQYVSNITYFGEPVYTYSLKQGIWSRLGAVFDVRDGTHDTPKYTDEGFPLITSKNIYTGSLSFESVKFISEKDHRQISERSRVDRGDILFAMIGSIGNPVIVDTDREFSIKNVALFKYYAASDAEPRFLLLYLNLVAETMREKSAGGVQSFVSLGFLRNYPFPLPPLNEQHRIVAKVDELMALCDSLKARLADAQAIQLHLADAIVEQAVC